MRMTTRAIAKSRPAGPALKALFGDYAWTRPLKAGGFNADGFDVTFEDVAEASTRFKPLLRQSAYHFGELALVSFLQAQHYGKPFVLLPLVVLGGFQHKNIAYNGDHGTVAPDALAGKRIGVRSYAQTTGTWVRGILQHEYGVDLDKVTWITFEDAHVEEYADPANCKRVPAGKKLADMLFDGELDAAMMGMAMPNDPRLKPVIPEPQKAAQIWFDRMGVVPINHILVVSKALCDDQPEIVRKLFGVMATARQASDSPFPLGFDADWTALELASRYAFEQGLVPHRYSTADLFADARRILGANPPPA